jgi:hypothetical protein
MRANRFRRRYFRTSRHKQHAGYPVRRGFSVLSLTALIADRPLEPVIGLAEGETRWRAMTDGSVDSNFKQLNRQRPALSRRDAPELCTNVVPQKTEGAGNAECPLHPQPRVRKWKAHELVTTGTPEANPAFPAQWF